MAHPGLILGLAANAPTKNVTSKERPLANSLRHVATLYVALSGLLQPHAMFVAVPPCRMTAGYGALVRPFAGSSGRTKAGAVPIAGISREAAVLFNEKGRHIGVRAFPLQQRT